MKKIFAEYRHLLWMLLFATAGLGYFLIAALPFKRVLIHSNIDDMIPFMPFFIVPYILWYIYVPLPIFIVGLKDKRNFFYQIISLFSGVYFCLLIFALFPNAIDFRPDVSGNDVFSLMCRIIFSNDTPVNVFPSLHCYEAASVHFSTFTFGKYRHKKVLRAISAVMLVLIILSTVFVKQHSVIDAVAGTLLAAIVDFAVLKIMRRRNYDNQSI